VRIAVELRPDIASAGDAEAKMLTRVPRSSQ
jgi:hypothetical protein